MTILSVLLTKEKKIIPFSLGNQQTFETSFTMTDFKVKFNEFSLSRSFKGTEEQIENIINDAIKDQLNRRQASEGISKHFLKFLSSMCGITEVCR